MVAGKGPNPPSSTYDFALNISVGVLSIPDGLN